ncbi:MAG: conjugal transfer protein TraX [Clostridiales bacterium]|nr:conjugal transfer protein TraX [Clostridiales bacterium]
MNTTSNRFRCLSGSTLKILAIIAMAVDHFAASIIYYGILLPAAPISPQTPVWIWYQVYQIMRFIGRIAFPIFCFLLVEGFLHTSDRKRYGLRLFLFALISELPFDLAVFNSPLYPDGQNVFFTLLIGLLVIWGMEKADFSKYSFPLHMICIAAGSLAAWLLKTDYDYKGIILIAILYFFRSHPVLRTVAGCLSLYWEAPACLAFIPLNLYNGKRGISLKYFFYLFYPVHLLLYALLLKLLF